MSEKPFRWLRRHGPPRQPAKPLIQQGKDREEFADFYGTMASPARHDLVLFARRAE